jgi:4'-phosphopantetheinyl transferase
MKELWARTPDRPHLVERQIHLWSVCLDLFPERLADLSAVLSSDERARARRFAAETISNRFIAARGSLRLLLGRYLDVPAGDLAFMYGAQGKPELSSEQNQQDLRFNLSHSKDIAVYALTLGCEIGIDVEYVRPAHQLEQIARRYFSQSEVDELSKASFDEEMFFRCWARKESFLKANAAGLSLLLEGVNVMTPGFKSLGWLPVLRKSADEKAYWIHDIDPAEGYVGAVAAESDAYELRCWHMDEEQTAIDSDELIIANLSK